MPTQTLALITCTKSKASSRVPARDMYWPSRLFQLCWHQAESDGSRVAILSAKYGLLLPDRVIAPYNKTITEMSTAERAAWGESIGQQFDVAFGAYGITEVVFLAGKDYREPVAAAFRRRGVPCRVHPRWISICELARNR